MGNRFNIFLLFLMSIAWIPVALFLYATYPKQVQKFKMWANPVLGEYVATDWTLNPDSRYWSARVYGEKIDDTCVYIKGQKVSALVKISPESIPFEVPVVYIDDDTPDSNRPSGFQDFGRWQFQAPNIPLGSIILVSVQHNCPHRGKGAISSEVLPNFVVGSD